MRRGGFWLGNRVVVCEAALGDGYLNQKGFRTVKELLGLIKYSLIQHLRGPNHVLIVEIRTLTDLCGIIRVVHMF